MHRMKIALAFILTICSYCSVAQLHTLNFNEDWYFAYTDRSGKSKPIKWYKANVPGTIHTDLLKHKLIPDPYFRDNEHRVQWVETITWKYQKNFKVHDSILQKELIELVFDGLDTYATVILNKDTILKASNMFRQWAIDVKSKLRKENTVAIVFNPSAEIAKRTKAIHSISLPDNERVFVRKAQYQFGWDWGSRLVTCGIWRDVKIVYSDKNVIKKDIPSNVSNTKLVIEKDSEGERFYFTVNDQPLFVKGTNWIPADNFIPRATKLKKYEQLLIAAKEANINLIRVWGGGIYEEDRFYELCDSLNIMVWQDFMFAGALYPADSGFLKNIEEEVRYQVNRLKKYKCIVLWCGNNEIEEAWFNWGWQKQLNYTAEDSTLLWNNYKKIFHQLIPNVLRELDPQRPYWNSSPSLGWGRDSAYKKGDVHYWGVWWGKEPVEKYNEKIGRFVSEYGMQGMPNFKSIYQFTIDTDRDTASSVMRTHQKHPFGYQNIKYYIENKFRTPKSFEDLVYVSQLMQADAIKTAIEAHRRSKPYTMGTMFWQWNDCWPVVSWSAIDYYGRKKALYYEVKRKFADPVILPYFHEKKLRATVVSDKNTDTGNSAGIATLMDFYGNKLATSVAQYKSNTKSAENTHWDIDTSSLFKNGIDTANHFIFFHLKGDTDSSSAVHLFTDPKNLNLPKTKVQHSVSDNKIILVSPRFAYGVYIDVPDGVELEDNYFHLLPGEKKSVKFKSSLPNATIKKMIKIKSLVDTY